MNSIIECYPEFPHRHGKDHLCMPLLRFSRLLRFEGSIKARELRHGKWGQRYTKPLHLTVRLCGTGRVARRQKGEPDRLRCAEFWGSKSQRSKWWKKNVGRDVHSTMVGRDHRRNDHERELVVEYFVSIIINYGRSYGVVLQKSLNCAILASETSSSSAHLNCVQSRSGG